jgi:hypothetical protein
MKIVFLLFLIFLFSITLYSQKYKKVKTTERFVFLGKQPVLVANWSREAMIDGKGKLFNGDSIVINCRKDGAEVSVIHNNIPTKIDYSGAEAEFENFIIHVCEYDFDKDGENEIIIVDSPESMFFVVFVFKKNATNLFKMVGEFEGQIGVYLSKNRISLPIGSGGTGEEYLFIDGAFKKVKFKSRFFFIDG